MIIIIIILYVIYSSSRWVDFVLTEFDILCIQQCCNKILSIPYVMNMLIISEYMISHIIGVTVDFCTYSTQRRAPHAVFIFQHLLFHTAQRTHRAAIGCTGYIVISDIQNYTK